MQAAIEKHFKESYAKLTAALYGSLPDFDLVEEAIQEAFLIAWKKWPVEGIPQNPAGWLYSIAKRRAIDVVRREKKRGDKYKQLAHSDDFKQFTEADGNDEPGDERLSLIFTCCHPVINLEAQLALTLHTIAGLSTKEVAAAFLMKETALAQRIVRAKRKIKEAGVPFKVPEEHQLTERLDAVLHVLYLIFNEGYSATAGESSQRTDLCEEALFLGEILCELLPENSEVFGLQALMLLQYSRSEARQDKDGKPVLLPDQDRSLWDQTKIQAGLKNINRSLRIRIGGFFQIQAAIALEHSTALTAEATNWQRIVDLYDGLLVLNPSPVIQLNRAVAVGMAQGPKAALDVLDSMEKSAALSGYRWFHTTRGEFLSRLKRNGESIKAFEAALELCENEQDKQFVSGKIAELQSVSET